MRNFLLKFQLTLLFSVIITFCYAATGTLYYNVKDFGTKGDGVTLDSRAINQAIDKAASQGGGTVYLPPGNYLCGSIHLKSNISLFLDHGATIIAAPVSAENGYDEDEESVNTTYQDFGHSHWQNSLIWGIGLDNVAIIGTGWINGQNLYRDWVRGSKQNANKSIALYRCRNVLIRDITIIHGGWFAILATGVDNLTINNLKIDTNRDGMDIDCCKNVHVSDCSVNSPHDDGICLKSTYALGYAKATEDVTITNCIVSGYDEGTYLDGTYKRTGLHPTGRIKFGTESNGGFKNITISNCVFDYCQGLALETVDGGILEDVTISNIVMKDVVNDPVFMRLGARMRGPDGVSVGKLRRVRISNVDVYNADPSHTCTIAGLPGHDIEDIHLSNIHIYYKGGGTKEQAERVVPENANNYPEPGMFGPATAYGLFVRHAKNIRLNDVEFSQLVPDYRPCLIFSDVEGVDLRNVTIQKAKDINEIVLKDVTDFSILQSKGFKDKKMKSIKEKTIR